MFVAHAQKYIELPVNVGMASFSISCCNKCLDTTLRMDPVPSLAIRDEACGWLLGVWPEYIGGGATGGLGSGTIVLGREQLA